MNKGEIHVTNAIFNKTVAERFTFLKIKLFFPNLNTTSYLNFKSDVFIEQ